MTTLAQDTFVRANQSGWGTASDGETWTASGSVANLSISSNEGVGFGTNANDTSMQLGTQTPGDQEITCRIAINNINDTPGVQARFTAGGGSPTDYKFLYYGNAVHINKSVSGANSNLANSGAFTMALGTFYWFKIRCQGTTISGKVWQDGTSEPGGWTLQVTDSSISSGGFGVLINSNAGQGIQYDHFTATDTLTQITLKPFHLLLSSIKAKLSLKANLKAALSLKFSLKNKLALSFSEVLLAQPNSTIQVTVNATDISGNHVSNLASLTCVITFPDGTQSSTYSLTSGISNGGGGVYTLTYNTKGQGLNRELWTATDQSGNTTQYENTTPVSF